MGTSVINMEVNKICQKAGQKGFEKEYLSFNKLLGKYYLPLPPAKPMAIKEVGSKNTTHDSLTTGNYLNLKLPPQ